jgi:hypothetical protein
MHQLLHLAHRARDMRDRARAVFGFGLIAGRNHLHDPLDGLESLLDHLVHLSGDRQPLLRRRQCDLGIDFGARLARRRKKRGRSRRADRPRELESADPGATAAPFAGAHTLVEIRSRQADHPGNVVDWRQRLLVKPFGFGQQFRCDFFLGCQYTLPH